MASNNHTLYEIRSSEVQEVMNRPPGRLITGGNSVIFLTLAIGFWGLTLFKLPNTYETTFVINQVHHLPKPMTAQVVKIKDSSLDSVIELAIPVNSSKSVISVPATAQLFLDGYGANQYISMEVSIDSISKTIVPGKLILYASPLKRNLNNPSILLKQGMAGRIEIKTGSETIFKKLWGHLF